MTQQGPNSVHLIACEECGKQIVTRWKRQRYCESCGIQRRSLLAGAPRQTKPLAASRPDVGASCAALSVANSTRSIRGFLDRSPPEYLWRAHLTTPYSLNASKNRRWSNTGNGSVFLSRAVVGYQNALIARVKAALGDQPIWQNKVWIGLLVQKENHRSDAINVIDTICDAIKVAIGLDDRWFCIDRVDWEIVKQDPAIFISIGQTEAEHKIACSHCGQILSLDSFTNNKRGAFGKGRVCSPCSRAVDADRRQKRKAREAA